MFKKEILTSIFRRKGGEGVKTKLIEHTNLVDKINYTTEENENAILIYFLNNKDWILFTDMKMIFNNNQMEKFNYSELIDVKPALTEELKFGVNNPDNFTKILLKFNDNSSFIIDVEKGAPYKGIYQMLHYIASQNNT